MTHSIKSWLTATRYWSFPVSAMPVVATAAYFASRNMLGLEQIPLVLLCILGAVILHSAGNVSSDYFDHRTGVDNQENYSVPFLVYGDFQPREYVVFATILYIIGAAIGIAITIITGWQLLIVGGVGVLLTAFYPWLKYHALGDMNIFVVFGVLIILGTTWVITGSYTTDALVLALPIGIITVAVLHANNTSDIDTDREAGIRTFAMLIGAKRSVALYKVYMVLPFLCVIGAVVAGLLSPWTLICLVALVLAVKNIRAANLFKQQGIIAMAKLDVASAQLQLAFSTLLSVGLIIAALV